MSVNPSDGSKVLLGELDLDFTLPAPLPIVWQRSYSPAQRRACWLGQGWSRADYAGAHGGVVVRAA
ncbi:DUF6531 domain-containing protein [[Empedobacter] haloabium]|uniref:DUF6531 domain-containing protein n=1 Tax=[Empedobacter] haloabium TaxID=592317 RepID=A0ABZ1UFQ2_9BURK